MKTVYIMRHAVSESARGGVTDAERALTNEGRAVATRSGKEMAAGARPPDIALVSPALRTRQTFDCLCDGADWHTAATSHESFYLAGGQTWLRALCDLGSPTRTALIVGHHPGVDALAVGLAGEGDAESLLRLRAGFPTGAFAELVLDCAWSEIESGAGKLIRFVMPR